MIVDQNIDAKDLLVGDRNALMYAIRITGYGSQYEAKAICNECGEENDVTFDLSKYTEGYKETTDNEDITINSDGTFTVDLPATKISVQVKFMTGHDEERLTKSSQMKSKNNLPDSQLTDLLKSIVVSANGVTDPGELGQFLEMMPATDSRFLRNLYIDNSPNVRLNQEFTCNFCGSESEVEVPITTGFFWPEQ